MAWLFLFIAGIFEVIWAYCMKMSNGFTLLIPSSICLISMILSVIFLSLAMKNLPLSISYAVWTGIGTLGSFLLGFLVLHENLSTIKIIAAVLIFIGLVAMKLG